MTPATAGTVPHVASQQIRVRGIVQGVGFRPTVWRIARDHGLSGWVRNDADGVLIQIAGAEEDISQFCEHLRGDAPPLSRIDDIAIYDVLSPVEYDGFKIVDSEYGETHTPVTADAALCPACHAETFDPTARRFRYPFTNCTHCGPRFSIVHAVPYDRARTTMAPFELCDACAREYNDPADRRFHAQPMACPACGPHVWLQCFEGAPTPESRSGDLDDVHKAARLISDGAIVAIKGLGGFHLACDATNGVAVRKLRQRKHRYGKPFALMARDMDVIRKYCSVNSQEHTLLTAPEAPIVLLEANGEPLPDEVAPGVTTLGFMLPYTPLHALLVETIDRPLVMTSGNRSQEPQLTGNGEAKAKLADIADYGLFNNRDIANRIDDSVVRVIAGAPRLLRRARGYAPGAITLPAGFEQVPEILAMGGELKATFCLLKDGSATLSQHQGDLEDVATFDDYQKNLGLYASLYDHAPSVIAADLHPEYLSTKLAREKEAKTGARLIRMQHHHAHIASCLAENDVPLSHAPVLGVALDGVGYGTDGTIWGGEFMVADYRHYARRGTFKPIAMLGGEQAVREPWRNTYAHIQDGIGWQEFQKQFSDLELCQFLNRKPLATLDRMQEKDLNAPLASSCGRLFDAVAAAVGLCRDDALFEGQGAMMLEAAVCQKTLARDDGDATYPLAVTRPQNGGLPYIEPLEMWLGLFGDLKSHVPTPIIAAKFHNGLVNAIVEMASSLARDAALNEQKIDKIALSGGCFQNAILLRETKCRLEQRNFTVLVHARVPANDGGLALGQAVIAAARCMDH